MRARCLQKYRRIVCRFRYANFSAKERKQNQTVRYYFHVSIHRIINIAKGYIVIKMSSEHKHKLLNLQVLCISSKVEHDTLFKKIYHAFVRQTSSCRKLYNLWNFYN